MRHSCRIPEGRELLSITYNSDVIFEFKSATLKPGGHTEVKRVANVINLFPEMALDIEVSLGTNPFQANSHELQQGRAQAVMDALLGEGVHASRITTTVDRASSTLISEDNVTFKVIDRLMGPFGQVQAGYQNRSQHYCQAC